MQSSGQEAEGRQTGETILKGVPSRKKFGMFWVYLAPLTPSYSAVVFSPRGLQHFLEKDALLQRGRVKNPAEPRGGGVKMCSGAD